MFNIQHIQRTANPYEKHKHLIDEGKEAINRPFIEVAIWRANNCMKSCLISLTQIKIRRYYFTPSHCQKLEN